MKILIAFYDYDCRLFQGINRHFDKKILNLFFRNITHVGGARFTIITVLLLLIFTTDQTRMTALSSALALTLSHLPVHFIKKMYPRKRPYVILENTKFPSNPLQDHSFPSGHTTAIFSVIVPFVLLVPTLFFVLFPLAFIIGVSRIYLGLHYPTDIMAGGILGFTCGVISFYLLSL
jgi:undecaprenyl-diphosphatase